LKDYRATVHRGGKGVKAMQITEKTGPLVAVTNVTEDHDLMIITRSGITIRMKVADLRVLGRATQGVKLIDLRGKNFIASITKVPTENEEENSENPETSGNLENSENLTPESNNSEEGGTNNTNE
jgi:DNA gyrase subunit A